MLANMESQCDVLIIGAGPAGLMTALWLSRLNVKTRVIDKRATKVMNGQADGLQPRLCEMFESFGLWSAIKGEAMPIYDYASWAPSPEGGIIREMRQAAAYSPVSSYTLYTLNQGLIEKHMLSGIASTSGIKVERGMLPVSISIDESVAGSDYAYPVTVEVQHLKDEETAAFQSKSFAKNGEVSDGLHRSNLTADTTPDLIEKVTAREETKEIVRAKYVVGCDGAHSWVRQQMGFELEGESTDYIWGVIDIIPLTDFPDIRTTCMVKSKEGAMLVIPRERKLVRLYVQMAEVDADNGREARAGINPDTILTQAQKILAPYKMDYRYCDWWTAYQVGQRVSNSFQDKHARVFLAGDAVHTHSPKGGQGMNVSMHDGYNLGWKLGSAINNWTSRDILQTYEAERRKVAKDLIALDNRIASTFSSATATPEELRDVYTLNMVFMSGYGVHYPPSALTAMSDAELRQKNPTSDHIVSHASSSGHARKVTIGKLMPSSPILVQSVARPVESYHLIPSDGRWRLIILPGDITSDASFTRLNKLGDQVAPLVKQYVVTRPSQHILNGAHPAALPATMAQSLVDVHVVHRAARDTATGALPTRELSTFHPVFFPFDEYSGQDYEKVFVDTDMSIFAGMIGEPGLRDAGKLYENLGVDVVEGAMIITRPDQYVGWVGSLADVEGVKAFFEGVLKPQVQSNGATNGHVAGSA